MGRLTSPSLHEIRAQYRSALSLLVLAAILISFTFSSVHPYLLRSCLLALLAIKEIQQVDGDLQADEAETRCTNERGGKRDRHRTRRSDTGTEIKAQVRSQVRLEGPVRWMAIHHSPRPG